VQDAVVLNVGVGADADFVDVAANNRIHPDRHMLAEDHVADDLCGIIDIAGSRNCRLPAFKGSNHADFTKRLKLSRERGWT